DAARPTQAPLAMKPLLLLRKASWPYAALLDRANDGKHESSWCCFLQIRTVTDSERAALPAGQGCLLSCVTSHNHYAAASTSSIAAIASPASQPSPARRWP